MLKNVVRFLVLLMVAISAHAGEGQKRLDHFLDGLKTMHAGFVQTVTNARGERKEETRGDLWLSRPGRFRLYYKNPYEQIYVADGKNLWLYDRDLEQVTVKPQGESLGSTPATLLSSTAPLSDNFTIKEEGKHEGFQWLLLKPKAADSNFDYVRIAMEGDVLRAMEMVDGFGNTTRLYLEKVVRNPAIDNKRFHFTPPPGVDVIGEAQAGG